MYKNYKNQIITEDMLRSMSPYELGETGLKEALPYLRNYLMSSDINHKRLGASAINKLASHHKIDCNSLKELLINNLHEHPNQVRQYNLKALEKLKLSEFDLARISRLEKIEDKNYNRVIMKRILSLT